MSKVKAYSIDKKEKQKIVSDLFEIFVELKTKDEVFSFLLGLFTPSEVVMIARRIQVVKMIIDGLNYDEIRAKLKVSNQTITKMEHWLKNDDTKTEFIIRKINSSKKRNNQNTERTNSMLDKYALSSPESPKPILLKFKRVFCKKIRGLVSNTGV